METIERYNDGERKPIGLVLLKSPFLHPKILIIISLYHSIVELVAHEKVFAEILCQSTMLAMAFETGSKINDGNDRSLILVQWSIHFLE